MFSKFFIGIYIIIIAILVIGISYFTFFNKKTPTDLTTSITPTISPQFSPKLDNIPNPLVNQGAIDFLKNYRGRLITSITAQIVVEGIIQDVWVDAITTTNRFEFEGGIKVGNAQRESTDVLFSKQDLTVLNVYGSSTNEDPISFKQLKIGDKVRVVKIFDLTEAPGKNAESITINVL